MILGKRRFWLATLGIGILASLLHPIAFAFREQPDIRRPKFRSTVEAGECRETSGEKKTVSFVRSPECLAARSDCPTLAEMEVFFTAGAIDQYEQCQDELRRSLEVCSGERLARVLGPMDVHLIEQANRNSFFAAAKNATYDPKIVACRFGIFDAKLARSCLTCTEQHRFAVPDGYVNEWTHYSFFDDAWSVVALLVAAISAGVLVLFRPFKFLATQMSNWVNSGRNL